MDRSNFGQMLTEILHQKRMERKDLADLMKVHPSNVTRYTNQKIATPNLINRIEKALDIEIVVDGDSYIWIDKTAPALPIVEESKTQYQTNDHINKAKALVKKRLHDAIVEACMQTPEQHRAEVFKYFLKYQDSSEL